MPTPRGWRWVKLTDIARLESGHTPSRTHPEYWNGDIGWIGIPDAREHHGSVIQSTRQTVTQAGIDNSAARLLPAGTVCLSRTASVGYVTVMGRPMATSQDFVNWICSDALDPHFLKMLLVAEGEHLRRFGEGSTHTTIYFPEVEAFRVCIPSVAEQRRIVVKLEELRARSHRAKAALEAIPPLLDKLRQSVLAAAFRGDLTADWREKNPDVEPAENLLARIRVERRKKWEEAELAKMKAKGKAPADDRWKAKYVEPEPVDASGLPELPEGWCAVELGQVVTRLTNGYVGPTRDIYVDGGVPYLLSKHVKRNELRFDNETFVTSEFNERSSKSILRAGDVLLVQTGHVGESAVVPAEHEGHNCHAMIVITPVDEVLDGRYLSWFFSAPGTKMIFGALEKGMTLRHLNCHDVIHLATTVPPLAEQRLIADRVEAINKFITRMEGTVREKQQRLATLDRAILSKAFRGELVPQDPDDEPAEVMLARLKAEAGTAAEARPAPRRRKPAPA